MLLGFFCVIMEWGMKSTVRKPHASPYSKYSSSDISKEIKAEFYAQHILTKSPITLADQAEIAYMLSSSKFSKTTGQIISVDGGLHEAFLR